MRQSWSSPSSGPRGQHGDGQTQGLLGVGAHTFQSPQLVPFLPNSIPYALETLATSGLFSDGGGSFLQNL